MAVKSRKKVRAIPKGYEMAIPYLTLERAGEALAFYKKAFGAKLKGKALMMGDKVGHAELEIGTNGLVMLGDIPPDASQGQTATLVVYVTDVDRAHQKAVKAGAKSLEAPEDKFYGDRMCRLLDPFGVTWFLSTHVEDVTPAEMKKRLKAMMGGK